MGLGYFSHSSLTISFMVQLSEGEVGLNYLLLFVVVCLPL